jgi:hypothetical protein
MLPNELIQREMRLAGDAVRPAVERWIACVGLGDSVVHLCDRAAGEVRVAGAHRPDETLGPFLGTQDDMVFCMPFGFSSR